ncbi:MAG: hypothetical protein GXP54_12650, partial [Deltaproteobacteria bacterium]|nr:hypothetical protein [Deltaproteobacteria bacterium]
MSAFVLGMFTIGAQTALLREYLVLFQGNELAIGFFFACWFTWVAAGATLSGRLAGFGSFMTQRAGSFLALYPPAAMLGLLALVGARHLAGIPSYEPMTPGALFFWAFAASAPVSFLTGLLFPALCNLSAAESRSGASIGYVAEASGAFIGGILATAALFAGLDGIQLIALLGLGPVVLSAARAYQSGSWTSIIAPVLGVVSVLLFLAPPTSDSLRDRIAQVRLESSLEGGKLIEERHTPYQMLSVARLPGQKAILADGALEAVLPPGPEVQATAALLASEPRSRRRAVVLGQGGFPIALALTGYFDKVEIVALDPAAGDVFEKTAPGGANSPVFRSGDPREFVRTENGSADLYLIATPEPGTLLANRMYTREFFLSLARHMAPGGIVAVPFRSAENYVGTEFLRYGQSIWRTLAGAFTVLKIVPGETAVIMASNDGGRLSLDPAILKERYEAFAPRPHPFPASGFTDLVKPERIEWARKTYGSSSAPGDLINRDDRPLTPFLYLMTILRQSDTPGSRLLWSMHESGPGLAWAMLVLLLIVITRNRIRMKQRVEGFSAGVFMSMVGAASISASVALLAAFQSVLGAVYGEVGAATGIFMAGLGLGALASARLTRRISERPALLISIGFTAVAALVMAAGPTAIKTSRDLDPNGARLLFGAMFLIVGVVTGAAWPLAAAMMGKTRAASRLEAADHWGAAVGSGITGVFVVAMFGLQSAFLLLAGLFAVAGAALVFDSWLAGTAGSVFMRSGLGRALAFGSFPSGVGPGLITFVIVASLLVLHGASSPDPGMNPRIDTANLQKH